MIEQELAEEVGEFVVAPLPKADRAKFMAMVKRIVEENNAWSRAAKETG